MFAGIREAVSGIDAASVSIGARSRNKGALPAVALVTAPQSASVRIDAGTDARTAVLAFLKGVPQGYRGKLVLFRDLAHSYRAAAPKAGWPSLSDKAIVGGLRSAGAQRHKLDNRQTGGSRVVAYQLPERIAA